MRLLSSVRKKLRERGATLVEASMVIPLLLLLAIGSAEAGLTFVDWMSVSNAGREGARVGAAAGKHVDADQLILTVVARATCNIQNGELVSVRIFKAEPDGDDHPSGLSNTYDVVNPNCGVGPATWAPDAGNDWPSPSRNSAMGNLDYLGVEITFTHDTITGLFPMFNATWVDRTVMRIEPVTQ